ncbi:Uma2 family endonuclease [Nonomuraea sp. NPDC059194]|uniref:Uma2 family endonuclease n=1 Tax=Nonomuraea sp. NPDC059194 TaxID=3346764 RepID=UPI0036ACFAC3
MAKVLETYRRVCKAFPDHRAEVVNGRIVVSDVPTWEHSKITSRLLKMIFGVIAEHDWEVGERVKLFLGPQADRYVPDLTVVLGEPRTRGDDEVHAQDTALVVEVASPSSVHDDHVTKPREYAKVGVPLYLLIDPAQGIVILFSLPTATGYQHRTEVGLGAPLDLSEPWKITIDTGRLIDSDEGKTSSSE